MQVILENEVISLKKDLDSVIIQLVKKEELSNYKGSFPFKEYLDMVVLFYFLYETNDTVVAKSLVHNSDLELFELENVEQLYKIAVKNTQRLLPAKIDKLFNIMSSLIEDNSLQDLEILNIPQNPLYVVTNQKGLNGATVILYPDLLDSFSRNTGYNKFWLLPSSKHEFLALADYGKNNPAESLGKMVEDVNTTLDPEDLLSNHVYYYDSATKSVTIAF